jgi:hypothetical protein
VTPQSFSFPRYRSLRAITSNDIGATGRDNHRGSVALFSGGRAKTVRNGLSTARRPATIGTLPSSQSGMFDVRGEPGAGRLDVGSEQLPEIASAARQRGSDSSGHSATVSILDGVRVKLGFLTLLFIGQL